MQPNSRSLTTASTWSALLMVVAAAGCGDLTDGNAAQPVGALSLLSSSQDGLMPIDSTVRRTSATGTGSIGTVTAVSIAVATHLALDTLAIAPDGAPWATHYGQLLRVGPDDTVGVLEMPSGAGFAPAIASDGVGALWMANWDPQQGIGRLDPATGDLQLFAIPDPLARPTAVGSDGHGGVWLTGGDRPVVGRLDATNRVFVVAAESAPAPVTVQTGGVAVASDGQLFVSDYAEGRIGRVQGTRFEWTKIDAAAAPSGLAPADDGSVWFISLGLPNQVGRVDHDGILQTWDLPTPSPQVSTKNLGSIARAPDGAFWFNLTGSAALGRIDATGQLSILPLPNDTFAPGVLAFDPAGRLWFTNGTGFGRIEF